MIITMSVGSTHAENLGNNTALSEMTVQNGNLVVTILRDGSNRTMILEREVKGINELRFEALYEFASENGIDIQKFMDYLSEYSWNTMKPLTYEDVKRLLLEFSRKKGISLERIAVQKSVDLNFPTIKEIAKVLPQTDYQNNQKIIQSFPTGTISVDRIYDYYHNSITNQIRNPATFHIYGGHFVGIYASAWLKDGRIYYFTWTTYKDKSKIKYWVERYLKENYGIVPPKLKLLHIKYFIQGDADWMKRYSTTVYFDNSPVHSSPMRPYLLFELWSEATYTYSTNSWDIHGYPDDRDAGVWRIIGHPIKALAGFAFYSKYPAMSSRSFGGGSETHVSLTLYSNIWNQERLEGVGDWW
jgi:hypothetical protein